MKELTPDNAGQFLREKGWINPGPVRVEPLGWGVSNVVFRVQTDRQIFVLKQSRPQLRTRDAWFSDIERVWREMEVMRMLHPLLPEPTVPEVLFSDRDNYVFAMSHAPPGARVWKEQLLHGDIDLSIAELAGKILGRIHERTALEKSLVEPFADSAVFVQLRVDPFYRRIQERLPELADAVDPLIEQMLDKREALCHGDFSPKNILTHAQGFTLVDYETAHLGDPTMDLGFFLSHLLLKTIKRHLDHARHLELTRAFWRGYAQEVTFAPLAELQARGILHCGVCVLARIDGTSPVDYLSEEPLRQAARHLGRRLLLESPASWDDVLGMARDMFRHGQSLA